MKSKIILALVLFCALVNAQTNYVLNFNGTSDYVNLGSSAGSNIRSVEFWFNPSVNITSAISTPDLAMIGRNDATQLNEYGFFIAGTDQLLQHRGKLLFYLSDNGSYYYARSTTSTWTAGTWYHVCGVIDNVSGMKLYINGLLQTDTTSYTSSIPAAPEITTLGRWGDLSIRYFNGKLDDLRFWDRALSVPEIQGKMCTSLVPANETGLVGYWKMDEGSGLSLTDFTTNANNGTIVGANFVMENSCTGPGTVPCTQGNISVSAPFLRRCFSDQRIYVQACNALAASVTLTNAYVELELDPMLSPSTASMPYTNIGNNLYRFDVGNLSPGQCADFWVATTVSCDAVLGRTLCVEAHLLPVDSCALDTTPAVTPPDFTPCSLPWDHSSIGVDGWCENDSIYFTVSNHGVTGNGDMDCYAPMRLYIDGQYIWLDSIQLQGGDTDTLVFAGDGRTWRLEVDQHPLHPGNSHPNATVELCGNSANWVPNLVNALPQDDADPVVDIYCGIVTGSYDPNDKTGYPLGATNTHFIAPNGQIDYLIRFQNTGTDTAFTIIVRDTLDVDLDTATIISGASSHNYNFQMYGSRILQWTFNNIMLPDSTTDEPGSHGFISFTIKQNPDLPDGTSILNKADIYFDFNAPVITNQTSHVVNRNIQQSSWTTEKTITWNDCSPYTYNGIVYNQSGTYWQIVEGSPSDTLVTLDILVKSTKSSISATGCDNYTAPDGTIHTTSGIKTAIIPNTAGCDSTITIDLTLNYLSDIDFTVTQNDITLISNTNNAIYQWIDCNTNTPVSGETSQAFTASANGDYAVIIYNGMCSDTSSCTTISSVGLKSGIENQFKVIPNPSNENIRIELGEQVTSVEIILTNAIGQEVARKQFVNTSLVNMNIEGENGIYFLKIISGTKTSTLKIIKQQ